MLDSWRLRRRCMHHDPGHRSFVKVTDTCTPVRVVVHLRCEKCHKKWVFYPDGMPMNPISVIKDGMNRPLQQMDTHTA
jgi:hypothetical protein